jgi:transcription initiation factor TFIIIB Brf1 subunit/transcription initiation factor TFIIB
MHMVTCECGSKAVAVDGEWICTSCAVVLAPVYEFPRRRVTRKELMLARLYGYA